MICKKCGKQVPEQAAFCVFCGESVITPQCKECPRCGAVREAEMVYCHQCGTLLEAVTVTGKELLRLKMISKYEGEPTVGIAKGTGTLVIYDDRIEFIPLIGNALGNAFGLIGRMVMDKKNPPKNDVYPMSSVEEASEGKYAGLMPMLVIRFKTGSTFSFASIADGSGVRNAADTIEKYKMYTTIGRE